MGAKVIVLGGGFAGLAAVGELARARGVRVQLIDRRACSTFLPLLPDAISGRVGAARLLHPLREHCARLGVEFTRAAVHRIVPEHGCVETDAGTFSGDSLIVCLGCETNFFGDRAAAAHAVGLKSLDEAMRIRDGALKLLGGGPERAAGRRVVVVGGGYTGFEAASHVLRLLRVQGGWRPEALREVRPVVLVEKGDQVLGNCSDRVRQWSVEVVRGFGVDLRAGCSAESFADGGVTLSDGTALEEACVIWTAGVAPGGPCAGLGAPTTPGRRLAVDEFLRVPGAPGVFAAGDVAGPVPSGAAGPLRMAAQFSLAGGRCAARNALRSIKGEPLVAFRAPDLGYVVPLAPGAAAGVVLGREVYGRLPSALHYLMCAFRSWSWQDRAGVLLDVLTGGKGA